MQAKERCGEHRATRPRRRAAPRLGRRARHGGARPRTTSSPEAAASDSDATRTRGADEDAGASGSEGAEGADAGTTDAGADDAEAAGPQADAPSDAPGDGDGDGDHAYAGSEPVVGAGHDGHRGPEGPARRRSPALIASVAAAVLLAAAAGAYLAAGAAGDSGAVRHRGRTATPPPPLALDGYSENGPNGVAPGEPNPYGATYRAEGALPEGPDTAPVFHARGQVGEDRVVALAEALGIEGKPVAEGGSWRIGGQDGSGPTLRVDQQGPGTWTFSRNIPGSDNCKGATCKAPTGGDGRGERGRREEGRRAGAEGGGPGRRQAGREPGAGRQPCGERRPGGRRAADVRLDDRGGRRGERRGGRRQRPARGTGEGDTYPVVGAREALDAMNGAPGAGDRVEIGGCATPCRWTRGSSRSRAPR